MPPETILTNARVVTRDDTFDGTVVVRGGTVAAVERGRSAAPGALDLDGDILLPGLVEVHTDNMEKHFEPRPGVIWPSPLAAVIAHDTQIAGAGITTVLDAISVGEHGAESPRRRIMADSIAAVKQAGAAGLFRADHKLHMRCEVSDPFVVEMFEPYAEDPLVQLVSVMDHTPGQRQWQDLSKWIQYHKGENWSATEIEDKLTRKRAEQAAFAHAHRLRIVEACRRLDIPLASHDDANEAHVMEAVAEGVGIAEFPLTLDAAAKARRHGLATVMGAPNVVRGGSHSGNVSALDLAAAGHLDALSSDYVPSSLLHAAFVLHRRLDMPLAAAVNTVSLNPARMVRLDDRGEIATGQRADLVRVGLLDDTPVVRQVWRQGGRVS